MTYTAEAVKRFKIKSGLSYKEIAGRIGVSSSYLEAVARDGKLMSDHRAFICYEELRSPDILKGHFLDLLVKAEDKLAYYKELVVEIKKQLFALEKDNQLK